MEQSKMFGDIDLFSDKDFFESHKYGQLYFDDKKHGLEIFSYIECDAYDELVYGNNEGSNKKGFISKVKSKSQYYRDISLTENDHIVILSTCDYSYTNGRMVLLARITDEIFPNDFGSTD